MGCPVTAAVGGGAAIALTGGSAAPVAVPAAIALATTCGVVAATNQCDKIGRRKRSGQIEVRFEHKHNILLAVIRKLWNQQ